LSRPPASTTTLGAARTDSDAWSFVVWAPRHERLSVRVDDKAGRPDEPMEPRGAGYFSLDLRGLGSAPDYWYVAADGAVLPDPVSRWQPAGVHGASRGFDPGEFEWSDQLYAAPPLSESVLYELHIGTFTDAGTFEAAIDHLDELVDLGVTTVEPMPIAAFPGDRNWGYDGVFPFAVQDSYGGPAGFQRFVDACHHRGLAVVLDVVYNHLGPEGNVLASFAPYFTEMYTTPWGSAVNVAQAGSDEVRRYFIENALMWLRDYHVDGLRLDAIHGIVDPTASPFLAELTTAVDALAVSLGRRLVLIAESADNDPRVITPIAAGGLGFDAQWNDDFHHALHTVLTGERADYYRDYGSLDQLARAINDGFIFEGQHSNHRGRRHGAPSRAIARDHFVVCTQNHDQVGNRAGAERLAELVEPAALGLAAAALLLSPFVPMLFMGEEYAETAPFPYFVSHSDADLVATIRQARAVELGREADRFDPVAKGTFEKARLDRSRRDTEPHRGVLALYRALIIARRDNPVLTDPDPLESEAVVSGDVLALRRRTSTADALVLLNFGDADVVARADVAAPIWSRVLDSGDPDLGGDGRRSPSEVAAAADVTLGPYGFCLYRAIAAGGAG
jgi:maltooligosyltrehalose trehalohydrolase